jgi:hypothetical protein
MADETARQAANEHEKDTNVEFRIAAPSTMCSFVHAALMIRTKTKPTAMKRLSPNPAVLSRRSIIPLFMIKPQLSDSQQPAAQTHVLGLLLSALISASVLVAIATAALWTINFAYLNSFAETLGFSYSDFHVTPQEQLSAAWQSVFLILVAAAFLLALLAVVPGLILALWWLFETL